MAHTKSSAAALPGSFLQPSSFILAEVFYEDESQVEKEARSSFKEKAKKDESEIEVNDSPLSISVSHVTAPR
ncbi:hypothetical protein SI65_03122 [Aspergillus cristatus]|uniref:Uncharacterized protein n=1 Tax=Aspergillus cristatus TaxID=573508 RepID=A0A1E3BPG4_ASPCR|nr:hypothetical protein SI65_03122 [Aspergillus cristatus]